MNQLVTHDAWHCNRMELTAADLQRNNEDLVSLHFISDSSASRKGAGRLVQEAAAEQECRQQRGAARVREVHVQLCTRGRRATLLYVPVYVVHYSYGTYQVGGSMGSVEILRQHHQALIAAAPNAGVSVISDRHFSPAKASGMAAAAVAALKAAGVAAGTLLHSAPLSLAQLAASVATVDTAFVAFLAASAARVAAQGFTGHMREQRTARVETRAATLTEQYMQVRDTPSLAFIALQPEGFRSLASAV